jgi:L-lysine exporter family protein LysE/ArgO
MGAAFVSGFFLGLSLIVAIGAQNAFVLRQGVRQQHVLAVCLTCALSDAALIALGVTSFGTVARILPWIAPALRYGGAAFLVIYALRSFRAAWRGGESLAPAGLGGAGLGPTLMTCLAFTWANPHVYLDTVVLVGSLASHFPGRESAFGIGAASASAVFFFALGYGARLLRPLFAKPSAWRLLDCAVGGTLCAIAARLLLA